MKGTCAFEQIEETRELTTSESEEKELLVGKYKRITKRMAEINDSPEYESQQLIEELEQLKRTNLFNKRRIEVIEKCLCEIKSKYPI